ncbi:MAG: hypothetical protein LBS40_05920 [Burkholderiales bacterium]|jgi:hydrogenase-1 operon protein HyaE|nr:hypothetical protein [Burkholderiales bacterium]
MTDKLAIPPLLVRLLEHPQAMEVTSDNFDRVRKTPGWLLLFFTEDPLRYRETLDFAVIAPELLAFFSEIAPMRLGVLLPEMARAYQPRYGFCRWPAFVLLRDGKYLGAIDGMRTWDKLITEMTRLINAEPVRLPTIRITVQQSDTGACH